MLAALRAFAKSWVAALFMGVLMVSFLFFGVRDVFHPNFSNAVITAGSTETSPGEFKRDFGIFIQEAEQRTGQEITVDDAVAAGLDQRVMQTVEAQEALTDYVQNRGVRPADYLVSLELNQAPAFQGPLGDFDQSAFDRWLQENGLTAVEIKRDTAGGIALKHYALGLGAGLQTPKIYGAVLSSYALESRTVSLLILDPHSVPTPAAPTDAQLQALINEHKAELLRPEMRTLTVVRFSATAVSAQMPVDQAKVQALYAASKDKLSQPEKRTLVEFATHDAGKAQAILAALKAGQSPDAIAKAQGVPPIVYTDKAKTDVVDPDVADAAFAAQSGQVIGPVKSALSGFAVVQIGKVTPGTVPTLEQLRPQLEAQVKQLAARAQVFDAVKKYQAAHDGGASLADSAKAAGAQLIPVGPVGADGKDVNKQPIQGLDPKLLKIAFSLNQGAESELTDAGQGDYFALRVDKIAPPAVPTLADIRPDVTKFYMQQAILTALAAEADKVADAIRKGESILAAAAAAHTKPIQAPNVTRQMLQRQLQPDMIEALFAAKQGEVVSGQVGPAQYMVAHIDQTHPADPAAAARDAVDRAKAFNDVIAGDMIEAAETHAVSVVRPSGDLAAARAALGVAPDQAKSGAPPKRGPAL
jgi:peptidyl-prolyl cis-trans isomerase D